MSRARRWQPPHPDPAKPNHEVDTRRAQDAMRTVRDAKPRFVCTWLECPRLAAPQLDIPMCLVHAKTAAAAYGNLIENRDRAAAEQAQTKKQAIDNSTRKVEAGIPLAHDDPSPGWIYYIQNGDTIKIGYAVDVYDRMRAYPPNVTLLAVEPGTKKLERVRHSLFHAHLAHGREWFRDDPELRDWIDALREQHGNPSGMAYKYGSPADKRPIVGSKRNTGIKKTAA